ncbi:MAG: tetratricopeptide repeat protein [Armatimonadetes bacterium]|nr:tetratricopeptide repeat protein [Armatimonadota bacterium]
MANALAQAVLIESALLREANHCAGSLAYNVNDYAASQAHHETAFALSESLGDTLATGRVLHGIASCVLYKDNDIPRVLELTERARTLYQTAGDALCESRLLLGFSTVYEMKGNNAESLRFCEKALRLAEPLGDKRATAQAHHFVGSGLVRVARVKEAQTHLETALRLHREIGDRYYTANALLELGTVAYEHDDYDAATRKHSPSFAPKAKRGRWRFASATPDAFTPKPVT